MKCPWCGKELTKRLNKKLNKEFWGCSGFPKCKFSCGLFQQRKNPSWAKFAGMYGPDPLGPGSS